VRTPQFASNEYVSAAIFNAAVALLGANSAEAADSSIIPGLLSPSLISFAATGLVLGSTLPAPFGVAFGSGNAASGAVARAHGTVSNADTQSYITDFTSIVPGSGSVTAYLLAAFMTIQQGPYQVLGPPPGHPDYNPSFVPYTAYSSLTDSLVLSASTTPADNLTTFELCRFSLAAGASGLGTPNTNYQLRSSSKNTLQPIPVSGTVNLTYGQAGRVYNATASGTTFALPAVSDANGSFYGFTTLASGVTIQVNGMDQIYGYATPPVSGVSIAPIVPGSYFGLLGMNGAWQVVATSSYLQLERISLTSNTTFYVATSGNGGSDSNLGTFSSPWLTGQHAVDVLYNQYDSKGFNAQITFGAGTFSGNISIPGPWVGGGTISFEGVGTNTTLTCVSGDTIAVQTGAIVSGGDFIVTSPGGNGIFVNVGGVWQNRSTAFGVCGNAHILLNGFFQGANTYTLTGNATYHIQMGGPSAYVYAPGIEIAIFGTVTLTTFILGGLNCAVNYAGTTFSISGSFTGQSVYLTGGSRVFTQGALNVPGTDPYVSPSSEYF
jgi:hypothetical protein